MQVKEESEKVGLKLNIQASGPFTSWQTDGETMETVTDFLSLGSKITADGGCSHEMKKYLLLERNGSTRPPDLPPEKCLKQQFKLDMEQQTGFKSGKEYIEAVYCHPAYLTYLQSTS